MYCELGLEFIVVTSSVDIVQCYCVLCGVFCGYSNSWHSNITELCVEFIVVKATVYIVQ